MTTTKAQRYRKKLEDQKHAARESLGNSVICERCGATFSTYDDTCPAPLDEPCPGFLTIEAAMATNYSKQATTRQ